MFVHVKKEKTVAVDKINSRTWPAGWKGDIHADVLQHWGDDDFELIDVPGEVIAAGGKPADQLTAEQVSVLATAADQALAHAHSLTPQIEAELEAEAAELEAAGDADKSEGVKA